jgi:hypothetical protein
MIDFPASPTLGQSFTAAGVTWFWDGTKWLPSGLAPTVVPGNGVNRIINGEMIMDARNKGVGVVPTGTPLTFTLDHWIYGATVGSKFQVRRVSPPTTGPATQPYGFNYFMQAMSQGAYPPLATDTFYLMQRIEADMVSDFLCGYPNAQPMTLSFWANTLQAGTYSGSIASGDGTRSYAFTFPLAGLGLERIVVNIPGDTGGVWAIAANGTLMQLRFDLGSGANYRIPAGVWTTGNFVGANGAINTCATNGGTLSVTGVKLELGVVATPYAKQSLMKTVSDCQRYYQEIGVSGRFWAPAVNAIFACDVGWSPMRGLPAATLLGAGTRSANISGALLVPNTFNSGYFTFTSTTASDCYAISDLWSLSAEL